MGSEKSYEHRFNREDVISVAKNWAAIGADVYISEKEGLRMGVTGWKRTQLKAPTTSQVRRFGNEEWVTYFQH